MLREVDAFQASGLAVDENMTAEALSSAPSSSAVRKAKEGRYKK